jgi:hypothetical protein
MEAEPTRLPDEARVEELALSLLLVIRENYRKGPPSRDRVLEGLNALAFCAAHVIKGCGRDPAATDFFKQAFIINLREPYSGERNQN